MDLQEQPRPFACVFVGDKAFIVPKCGKIRGTGGGGGCLAFEELIRLSHLNVHSVWDSLWKSQFYIFLTVPLMSADNVQQLPGSPHLIIKSLAAETNSADPSYALLCVFLTEKQLSFMPPSIFTLLLWLNIIQLFICQPIHTVLLLFCKNSLCEQ